jgi:hypothetical protein
MREKVSADRVEKFMKAIERGLIEPTRLMELFTRIERIFTSIRRLTPKAFAVLSNDF